MNKTNKMEKPLYLLQFIAWGSMAYLFFVSSFFQKIVSPASGLLMTSSQSKTVLIATVLCCYGAGIAHSIKDHRNGWCLALELSVPYGAYLVLETFPNIPAYYYVLMSLAILFAFYLFITLVMTPVHKEQELSKVFLKRLRRLAHNTYSLVAIILCMVYAINLGFYLFVGPKPEKDETSSIQDAQKTPNTIIANIQELKKLDEASWPQLTLTQKMRLLQIVADIEADYLGLPYELQVKDQAMDDDTMGSYQHSQRLIRINREHVLYDSVENVIDTILHEVAHCRQACLCEVYWGMDEKYRNMQDFSRIEEYCREFDNYSSGKDNFKEYYFQSCEQDARSYAESRFSTYKWYIATCNNSG